MEDVVIFYCHLVYFTAIWYILWPFGVDYCNLVYIFPIFVCCKKKNLATLVTTPLKELPSGAYFSYIFFRGIYWKNNFQNFSRGNSIFSQHFLGKIFRGIFPKNFPRKKCTKNRPLVQSWRVIQRVFLFRGRSVHRG
jgi:hypothetical protein